MNSIIATARMAWVISPFAGVPGAELCQQCRRDRNHEGGKGDAAADREKSDARAVAEACENHCQHHPGRGIVHRSGGQRQGAERAAADPAFVDYSSEHRESGDGDAGTHEERRLGLADLRREEAWRRQQPGRQRHRHEEWRGDAGQRHGCGAPGIALEVLDVEAEADDEHVQADTELGDHEQDGPALRREEVRLHLGCEQPKKRGPKHHAGDHLPDHLRLNEIAAHQPPHTAAGRDDQQQLKEESDRELGRGHHLTGAMIGGVTGAGTKRTSRPARSSVSA
jgi:hypothetical protein